MTERDSDPDREGDAGNEVGIDHEREPRDEMREPLLLLPVDEDREADDPRGASRDERPHVEVHARRVTGLLTMGPGSLVDVGRRC